MQEPTQDTITDREQALAVVASFGKDNDDTEDRFNRALVDARMRPFFVEPRAAPDVCAFHLDPSAACFAREVAGGPWRATRCGRASVSNDGYDSIAPPNNAVAASALPLINPTGRDGVDDNLAHEAYETFCAAACASMRHPDFALVWRHGSSRRGTLLDGVPKDSTLIAREATFVAAVHRACIALLPDVVGDPTSAILVYRAAKEIARRFSRAPASAAHAPPDTCHVYGRYCSMPESVLCMHRENAVVVAFCEAVTRWRSAATTDNRDAKCKDNVDDECALPASIAWAADVVSSQEATERLVAEERARSRQCAHAALEPVDSVRYVYFCHRQFFRHAGGLWTHMRRVRDVNGVYDWAPVQRTHAADGSLLAEPVACVYDDDGVERLLAAHIVRVPDGLGWATVCRDDGSPYGTLVHMDTRLEKSPIVAMAADAVLSWSIGPSVLATEMAARAIEALIASRPVHAKRLAPTLAALSVAQRAVDALYADDTARRLVIEPAIVQGANRAMGAIPMHFQGVADGGADNPLGDCIGRDVDPGENSFVREDAACQSDATGHHQETEDDNEAAAGADCKNMSATDDTLCRRQSGPYDRRFAQVTATKHYCARTITRCAAVALCGAAVAAALVLL
ncbi:hypothetical protein psal_cds_101 [Pandoravirus salinus]|uniref:Uncharacterized protein n=1 Tax=Pandoravirus salinus TaxID=1349410 RepID=S4VTB5_9VIRU|nr:hypothetical protein psal_cds_101 [Pandoravirus salinus]AGO83533.1 hypothetical protein psal_cds_101 [Pandoravirus salinus]